MRLHGWIPIACLLALSLWISRQTVERSTGSVRPVASALPERRVRVEPQPVAATLLAPAFPANAEALSAALPAPAGVIGYVTVNRGLVEGKASPFWQDDGVLHCALPSGETVTIEIARSEMLGADRFVSEGAVRGDPLGRAVFAYNAGFLSATIETGGRSFALRPATEVLSQWYEVDPAKVLPCGGPRPIPAAAQAAASFSDSIAAAATTAAGVFASAQQPEVDVMLLYTQDVKTTLSGAARQAALQSECDAAVARVNSDLAASQVAVRLRLVKVAQTTWNEQASADLNVQDDALTALAGTTDGQMDEIHALRDQVGADIVGLLLSRADFDSSGLGYVLDTPSVVDSTYTSLNGNYAFAVVQYSALASSRVLSHELGHVFGCSHARGDPGSGEGAFSYSFGYRFFGTNGAQYRDIMAYFPGTSLSYFSNPRLTLPPPISAPIGMPEGQFGAADCAQTIERTAFEVAGYRLAQAAPAGTLVNVSTLSHVGSGDRVLIGGFYVQSAMPKRLLIRAAGPALTGLNVANALVDPVLRLHSGASIVASNDNWGAQADGNAAAVATAAAGAYAFPFAPGSADAALIATLPSGGYTAVVEGKNGATGASIIEVYDLERGSNRVVNLSSRGYAAKGQEMFAGFVVEGSPGVTKRILIRALGPTLTRDYGVNGMPDPCFALHDQDGKLVYKVDDWGLSNTVAGDDFTPRVTVYSQQQIAVTGFAPRNRREPAALLDLLPGSYTVIAQPFEKLDDSPPQVAQPGVLTVEVYEIAQ